MSYILGHCSIVICELAQGRVNKRQVKRFGLQETTVVSEEGRAQSEPKLGSRGLRGGGQEKQQ